MNGIDFLEVLDNPADPDEFRQRTLFVHFIKDLPPGSLTAHNVRIEGGERVRNVKVTNVTIGSLTSPPSSPPLTHANVLIVDVSEPGDFSTYTLRLVDHDPPLKLAPLARLHHVSRSRSRARAISIASRRRVCPPEPGRQPEIDYLAKDYASFRRLMLDRMSRADARLDRSATRPTSGIALVELLAYVGDYLSYQQDAVATEAYLGTARRRISVRRHARLVDYHMHDGSNARAWVQVQVADGTADLPLRKTVDGFVTRFVTRSVDAPIVMGFDSPAFMRSLLDEPEQFELVTETNLFAAHNRMRFYTWGAPACCLPKGATRATLRGAAPHLATGDVLVLMEVRGPLTGESGDADPSHRHAVRLTKVAVSSDPLGGRFDTPPTDNAVAVTEIEWGADDALPFPICVSAGQGDSAFDDVSVALGNIVLVDQGVTVAGEELPAVPPPHPALRRIQPGGRDRCAPRDPEVILARYRPALKHGPLTHAADYRLQEAPTSAAAVMRWPGETPLPSISLRDVDGASWLPKADLLASGERARDFVVEVEGGGTAYLRFGDNHFGARPKADATLTATYRVGNGARANIGRETLAHVVSKDSALASGVIERVWNPIAAAGGADPETLEEIRQRAPSAFRIQERAVTPADYEEVVAKSRLGVQRAAATFRWTGSWRTVFLTADRLEGQAIDPAFADNLRASVEPFRMAGFDLGVDAPRFVSLDVEMSICVSPAYFAGHVQQALLEIFSNRVLPDGRTGMFHPDNFSFGEAVYLSPMVAAAQLVAGVDAVRVVRFQRQGQPDVKGLDAGKLTFGRLEIARLDNDPNFPERGVFTLKMEGGR